MTTILATLILCASASAADPAAGPVFGIWHIDGHGYQWQVDQIDAGLPMEPSIKMVQYLKTSGATYIDRLNEDAVKLSRFSGMSIVLRADNISGEFDRTIPRVDPLTEDNWRTSHMCIRRLADGTLDDTPTPCPFSGTEPWSEAGRLWATSPWMTRLQEIVTPTSLIIRDNNEGGRVMFTKLYDQNRPRVVNSQGGLSFAEVSSDPSLWVDPNGAPLTADWIVFLNSDTGKLNMVRWKSDDVLDGIDLRAKEWVAPRRETSPIDPQHLDEFTALENSQYHALHDAFHANLSPAWNAVPFRTVGYGRFDENRQNHAASVTFYPAFYLPNDVTDPAYLTKLSEVESEPIPECGWPEWSTSCAYREQYVYAGAVAGNCDVVDSESYAAWITHLCWRRQSPGRELRITEWHGYLTPPDKPVIDGDSGRAALTALGREDVLDATVEDYELATLRQFARIHQHPVLSRYWREGTTEILDSANNEADVNRVWATETEIAGEPRKLLTVYTPCTLESIAVGPYTVGGARFAYYLTDPLEPLPDVVPDELTIEERVESLERRVDALEGIE